MQYIGISEIVNLFHNINGYHFIKKLWYLQQEGFLENNKNNYFTFLDQKNYISTLIPIGWELTWNGPTFSLSSKIDNHGHFTAFINENGKLTYFIS